MMRIFIWERLVGVTYNWHDEGGIVVIAPTVKRAMELAREQCPDLEGLEEPDWSRSLRGKTEERVFIFPDSGCC